MCWITLVGKPFPCQAVCPAIRYDVEAGGRPSEEGLGRIGYRSGGRDLPESGGGTEPAATDEGFLVRSSYKIALTPDSLEAERQALEKWAAGETDSIGKAVLNSLLGTMTLEERQPDWEKAIRYFRQSLEAEDLLGRTPAKDFRPMTVSESFSERYFDDNLFDLLARRAILALSTNWNLRMNTEVQGEILALYHRLMAFYDGKNRNAALLTQVAYLVTRSAGNMYVMQYRLENQEVIRQLAELAETYRGRKPVRMSI